MLQLDVDGLDDDPDWGWGVPANACARLENEGIVPAGLPTCLPTGKCLPTRLSK